MINVLFQQKNKEWVHMIDISNNTFEKFKILCNTIELFTDENKIYLPETISINIFIKILEFVNLYNDDVNKTFSKPITEDQYIKSIDNEIYEWIYNLSFDKTIMFQVLNTSNYMIIPILTDLILAFIAIQVKYKNKEEITQYFS